MSTLWQTNIAMGKPPFLIGDTSSNRSVHPNHFENCHAISKYFHFNPQTPPWPSTFSRWKSLSKNKLRSCENDPSIWANNKYFGHTQTKIYPKALVLMANSKQFPVEMMRKQPKQIRLLGDMLSNGKPPVNHKQSSTNSYHTIDWIR